MNDISIELEAANAFFDESINKSCIINGERLWPGWAFNEAFLAGIKWHAEKMKRFFCQVEKDN